MEVTFTGSGFNFRLGGKLSAIIGKQIISFKGKKNGTFSESYGSNFEDLWKCFFWFGVWRSGAEQTVN